MYGNRYNVVRINGEALLYYTRSGIYNDYEYKALINSGMRSISVPRLRRMYRNRPAYLVQLGVKPLGNYGLQMELNLKS